LKLRKFFTFTTYRIVEVRQPASRLIEPYVGEKIHFTYPSVATQDQAGFLTFQGIQHIQLINTTRGIVGTLPICRILKEKIRTHPLCSCSAYRFPHRQGSGECHE
jgi:hypothetical protein